jgi:hypothetical protein
MVRISLSKLQRAVVFVVAAAIIVVQLFQFADYGLRGHGWIWSFLVAGALVVLALFPTNRSPEKSAFVLPPKEELDKMHAVLRENAEVLSVEVEQRAKALSEELVRNKDDMTRGLVHTFHGSKVLGDQVVKQLNLHIYEKCLFLMLGLVGMRRSGGKELYITGIEFKTLQEDVSKKVMATAAASFNASPIPLEPKPDAVARSVLAELLEVRKTITAYCVALKSQSAEPEAALLKWFEEKAGLKLHKNGHIAQALQRSDDVPPDLVRNRGGVRG